MSRSVEPGASVERRSAGRTPPALLLPLLLLLLPGPASAGSVLDPGGEISSLVADPARNRFYLALDTQEVVVVDTDGTVGPRLPVAGGASALAVSRDGAALYVGLADSHDVAVYDLPDLALRTTFDLSFTAGPTALAAGARRLFAIGPEGLAIVDTATGTELYSGALPNFFAYSSPTLALGPDDRTLYALNTGLSPATLRAYDVRDDAPVDRGFVCSGIGSNGRQVAVSPDGGHVYVAVGGVYYAQVVATNPLMRQDGAGLTGPYPNSLAVSADGSRLFVGYQKAEFAAVRTSDWLPFHVGTLQGRVHASGLAVSADGNTLAAAIEDQSYDPTRLELVDVSSPTPNRGGVRLSPVDAAAGIPITGALIWDPPFQGSSAFVDVRGGAVARAPILPGPLNFDLRAPSHATLTLDTTIVPGEWSDLGRVEMTRAGEMPPPSPVCGTPALARGATQAMTIHGQGFFPGPGFEVSSFDPELTIDDFAWVDWATISATVTVSPSALPGLRPSGLLVTNPDAQLRGGSFLIKDALFVDGFESGDTTAWSSSQP